MPGKILAAIFFAVSFTFVYRSFSACVSALTFRKKKGGQFGRLFLLQFALLWTAFVGDPIWKGSARLQGFFARAMAFATSAFNPVQSGDGGCSLLTERLPSACGVRRSEPGAGIGPDNKREKLNTPGVDG